MMGQFRKISTAKCNREWIRLRKAYGVTGYECTRRGGRWVEMTSGDVRGSRLLANR
jgi:hypothetical protein